MPELLSSIKSNGLLPYFDLLRALGPEAEAVLPLVKARLPPKDEAFGAGLLWESIKPGGLAGLPEKTKQQMAAALYDAIVGPKAGVMAGVQARALVGMGKPAVPTILRLLRNEDPRYRKLAARALHDHPFPDEQLEAELRKLAQGAADHLVRDSASRALRALRQARQNARPADAP